MEELIIDKEFRDLIPRMTMEEYGRLTESIKVEGCREAIVTWNNVIVDGHTRYEICMRYDISFRTIEKQFSDRDEARRWTIFNQLSRRNLSDYDRIRLASQLKGVFKARASFNQLSGLKQNQNSGDVATTKKSAASEKYDKPSQNTTVTENFPQREITPIKTREEIADLACVSGRTVDKFNAIEEKGTAELKQAASQKKVSIHTAAAIAELPVEEQKEILNMPAKEIVKKAKEVRQQRPNVAEAARQISTEKTEIRDEIRSIATALEKLATDKGITVEYMAGQLKDAVSVISRIIDRISSEKLTLTTTTGKT